MADSLPMRPRQGEGCSHVDILASLTCCSLHPAGRSLYQYLSSAEEELFVRRVRKSVAEVVARLRALAAAELTAAGRLRAPFRLCADRGAQLLAAMPETGRRIGSPKFLQTIVISNESAVLRRDRPQQRRVQQRSPRPSHLGQLEPRRPAR
jgi:hypothetical protein